MINDLSVERSGWTAKEEVSRKKKKENAQGDKPAQGARQRGHAAAARGTATRRVRVQGQGEVGACSIVMSRPGAATASCASLPSSRVPRPHHLKHPIAVALCASVLPFPLTQASH
jgi:hypothetical protein